VLRAAPFPALSARSSPVLVYGRSLLSARLWLLAAPFPTHFERRLTCSRALAKHNWPICLRLHHTKPPLWCNFSVPNKLAAPLQSGRLAAEPPPWPNRQQATGKRQAASGKQPAELTQHRQATGDSLPAGSCCFPATRNLLTSTRNKHSPATQQQAGTTRQEVKLIYFFLIFIFSPLSLSLCSLLAYSPAPPLPPAPTAHRPARSLAREQQEQIRGR